MKTKGSNTVNQHKRMAMGVKVSGGGSTKPAKKKYAKGGSVGSASSRADGIARKGRTHCKEV